MATEDKGETPGWDAAAASHAPLPVVVDRTGTAPGTVDLADDAHHDRDDRVDVRSTQDVRTEDLPIRDPRRYDRLGEHARGGIGRISSAHDRELERQVAIKELLHPGQTAEARFIREAKITARLEHPAIVPVHEAGRWPSGAPFYVMKMVDGRSLKEAIDDCDGLPERLGLLPHVVAVADAIAYAHSKRVIHRDLKPSNVIVGAFGETVVIDWGLAKDLDEDDDQQDEFGPYRTAADQGLTATGAVVGTPAYMPPEQAAGGTITEQTDVYSLGALLYHVLAGQAPYAGKDSAAIALEVVTTAPVPVTTVEPRVPGELAAIVAKAMARDPSDRYASAAALTEELKRFQAGQLVGAHEYTRSQLLARWVGRHRMLVAAATAVLTTGLSAGAIAYQRVSRERDATAAALDSAQRERDNLVLVQARTSLDRDPTSALAWLKTYRGDDVDTARDIAADAFSRGVSRFVFRDHTAPAMLVLPLDDRHVLTSSLDQTLRVRDVETGTSEVIADDLGELAIFAVSPDGHVIVHDSPDGTLYRLDWPSLARSVLGKCRGTVLSLGFSRDGSRVLSLSDDHRAEVWDVPRGTLVATQEGVQNVDLSPDGTAIALCTSAARLLLVDVDGGATNDLGSCVAAPDVVVMFSPSGDRVLTAQADGALSLWDLQHRTLATLREHQSPVVSAAFSPDGTLLASGDDDGNVILTSLRTGDAQRLWKHAGPVTEIVFSKDGRFVASASMDHSIRLLDLPSGTRHHYLGHTGPIVGLAFIGVGGDLLSTSSDGTARLWRCPPGAEHVLSGHTANVLHAVFSPDGHLLATESIDTTVRLWNTATWSATILQGHTAPVCGILFTRDSKHLVSAGWDGTIRVWDTTAGTEKETLRGHEGIVRRIALSADDHALLSGGQDGTVRLWNLATGIGRVLTRYDSEVYAVAIDHSGELFASSAEDGSIRISRGGHEDSLLVGHRARVRQLVFLERGGQLLSASSDGTVRQWDTHSLTGVVVEHGDNVTSIAVSPDGQQLASSWKNGEVRIRNLATSTVATLRGEPDTATQVAFAPDGTQIVTTGSDGVVRVFDLAQGARGFLRGHEERVADAQFAPEGGARWLASTSFDRTVRIWHFRSAQWPTSVGLHAWLASVTSASIDDKERGLEQ